MAKLDIGGTQIEISDDFLKLSPQAQDDFVKNTIIPSEEFKAAQATKKPVVAEEKPQPSAFSEFGKAINPLEMAREVGRTGSEGIDQILEAYSKSRGAQGAPSAEPQGFFSPGLVSTGKAALGASQVALSPIIGLPRNIIGHTMTGLEQLARTAIDPERAKLSDLGQMYDVWRGDVDKAMMAMRPAGAPARLPALPGRTPERFDIAPTRKAYEYLPPPEAPKPPVTPPPIPETPPGTEAALAAQRLGIDLPRALTGTPLEQQTGQLMSRQPLMGGTQIAQAVEDVPVQLGESRAAVAEQLGTTRPPINVASDIRETIGGAAEAETQAAEATARQTDEAARASWERTTQQREQAIANYEAQSARETGAQVGETHPTDMGDAIVDTVRANHDVARTRKNALYQDAGQREGTVYDEVAGNADRFVNLDLRSDRGGQGRVTVRPQLTPAAAEMQAELEAFSERARQRILQAEQRAIDEGHGQADRTGVSLREVETQRQILGDMAQGAEKPADIRAVGRIMDAFDDWQQRAMGGPHYEGDPEALPSLLRARAANRDFRERFGYNDRNDADKIINKIVRGERDQHIGPNDVTNALTAPRGDKSARVLQRIYEATGDHPGHQDMVQAIRGGFWDRLSSQVEGGRPRTPTEISDKINQFTRGQGRDLAAQIFSPADQALMQRHGQVLTAAERARRETAALHKANEPVPTEVPKGPMQELADRVLGKGQKSDEALFNTIEGYAKSKSRADLNTLADVLRAVGEVNPELRGSFLNTFIRRLGTGQKDAFSPAIFEKEWRNITPQTKAVLTGNAGEQVRALDDIAMISRHFDDVHKRFGNPSGSGHLITFAHTAKALAAAAIAGTFAGPLYTAAAWFGGVGLSRFLATPQGAASLARFSTRLQRLQNVPTAANAAGVKLAVNNVRNTALALGISPRTRKD